MIILGLHSALDWDSSDAKNFSRIHDSGCTLFIDGKHIRSIDESRLTRVKYEGNYPVNSIDYCLDGIPREDVDIVAFPPSAVHLCNEQIASGDAGNFFRKEFPNAEIWYLSHHLCHAASTVFTAPFNSGSFLTLDGMGSSVWDFADGSTKRMENNSIGYFNKDKREFRFFRLESGPGENSFGDYYMNLASQVFNGKTNNTSSEYSGAEGKVMGLSAYGKPSNKSKPYTVSTEYPLNSMNIDRFEYGEPIINFYEYDNVYPYIKDLSYEDQSAYLQGHFENAIIKWISLLREDYLTENVCLAGGVFLNVCANSLFRNMFENIHIPPWPNDSGVHFGAAVWAAYKSNETIDIPSNIALLGKEYSDSEIKQSITKLWN